MRSTLLAIGLALALTGCADALVKTTELGCDASATALNVLTAANNVHPFPATVQAKIVADGDKVAAVCFAPNPPTAATLGDAAFQTAARELADLNATFKKNGKLTP